MNGDVGEIGGGARECHSNYGDGICKVKGKGTLDLATAHDLVFANVLFFRQWKDEITSGLLCTTPLQSQKRFRL